MIGPFDQEYTWGSARDKPAFADGRVQIMEEVLNCEQGLVNAEK